MGELRRRVVGVVRGIAERSLRVRRGTMARELDGKLILVLEDQPETLVALVVLLEDAGAIVEQATTLKDVMQVLREAFLLGSPPDAIVCDLLLPDGNALKLPDELRKLEPRWHGPLVAISGEPDMDAAARHAGFDDFVPKIVSPLLPMALAQIFRHKR